MIWTAVFMLIIMFFILMFAGIIIRIDNVTKKLERLEDVLKTDK